MEDNSRDSDIKVPINGAYSCLAHDLHDIGWRDLIYFSRRRWRINLCILKERRHVFCTPRLDRRI